MAILDADQEGFLRSAPALIQTMGRAARHSEGQVILYADRITGSMHAAMDETARRRQIQLAYNEEHNIIPQTISKPVREQLIKRTEKETSYGVREKRVGLGWEKTTGSPEGKTEIRLSGKEVIYLEDLDPTAMAPLDKQRISRQLARVMNSAAKAWNFELAARIRDTIAQLGSNAVG